MAKLQPRDLTPEALTDAINRLDDRVDVLVERVDNLCEAVETGFDRMTSAMDKVSDRVDRMTDKMDRLLEAIAAEGRRGKRNAERISALENPKATKGRAKRRI